MYKNILLAFSLFHNLFHLKSQNCLNNFSWHLHRSIELINEASKHKNNLHGLFYFSKLIVYIEIYFHDFLKIFASKETEQSERKLFFYDRTIFGLNFKYLTA